MPILKNCEAELYDMNCDGCGYRREGFDSVLEAETLCEEIGYVKHNNFNYWLCPSCVEESKFCEDGIITKQKDGTIKLA